MNFQPIVIKRYGAPRKKLNTFIRADTKEMICQMASYSGLSITAFLEAMILGYWVNNAEHWNKLNKINDISK